MALRNIIYEGDSLLRKRSREVNEITDRIRILADDMWETMYEANGVGLAAPQVGVLRRLIVIDVTAPPEVESGSEENTSAQEMQKYVLINPEIVDVSEETVSAKEGCLSVPGMVGVVNRPARVRVRALDIDGNPFELEGEGMLAKALSHEIDHLDGILYVDKADSIEDVGEADDE